MRLEIAVDETVTRAVAVADTADGYLFELQRYRVQAHRVRTVAEEAEAEGAQVPPEINGNRLTTGTIETGKAGITAVEALIAECVNVIESERYTGRDGKGCSYPRSRAAGTAAEARTTAEAARADLDAAGASIKWVEARWKLRMDVGNEIRESLERRKQEARRSADQTRAESAGAQPG